MKQLSSTQIALSFAGCFMGAGFLSGQELWQFFGTFGGYGLVGMVLALAAFWFFGLLVLRLARLTGLRSFDHIIVFWKSPWLRRLVSWIFLLFLFSATVAMFAGAGALLEQVFGLPAMLGSALFSLLVLLIALTGAAGLVAAFSLVVPLLMVLTVAVTIWCFITLPAAPIAATAFSSGNPLLGNWVFAAVSFISYNMMATISIMVPLADGMERPKTLGKGLAMGSAAMAVLFVCILLPLILYGPLVPNSELPMLALAQRLAPALGICYAVLLLGGMFTSALSGLFAITERVPKLWKFTPLQWTAILCAASFVASLIGFKNVIASVYPVFGYIGLFALVAIVVHGFKLRTEIKQGLSTIETDDE